MAGSEEQTPTLTTSQLVSLIKQVRREPVERDTLYNEIHNYKDTDIVDAQMLTQSIINYLTTLSQKQLIFLSPAMVSQLSFVASHTCVQ